MPVVNYSYTPRRAALYTVGLSMPEARMLEPPPSRFQIFVAELAFSLLLQQRAGAGASHRQWVDWAPAAVAENPRRIGPLHNWPSDAARDGYAEAADRWGSESAGKLHYHLRLRLRLRLHVK
mmetsp:Transcript_58579/g.126769  ORF Transcript_58579/g.126769 Transcript_58579/m.126769 type:complete len:122 (-) Transcript_58579:449-814(-)